MKPLKFIALAVFAICSVGSWSQTVNIYSYSVPAGGYAPNGNLTNYTDSVTGSWSNQFDSLNRLKSATSNAGPYNGLNIQWGYDSFGNRLSQTPSGSNVSVPPATTMQYADGTNRITSSSIPGVDSSVYDAAGNLRFDGMNAIAYDAESRVCAVRNVNGTVTQYLYNAEGQRVAKGYSNSGAGLVCPSPGDFIPTEKYILGPSGEQVTQVDGSDVWQHTNVYANGELIATYDQEGSQQPLHFHGSDALGTRRVQISAADATVLSFSSLPYGDGFTTSGSGQDATEHHFTGKERDAESGLDNFGARYYSSAMGRFMSPDWDSDPDAVPYADFTNPQSLNLYSYVLNNPLKSTDEDGHLTCDPDTWNDQTNTLTAGACHLDLSDVSNFFGTIAQKTGNALSNAAQQTSNYLTAPRDSGCMNAFAGAGAISGAGVGAYAGAGIGAAGGGVVGFAGGGVGAIPGGIGGGIAGGVAGGAVGAWAGGAGGAAIGYFACASGGGGSGGGGGGGGGSTAQAKKLTPGEIAKLKQNGIDPEMLKEETGTTQSSKSDLYKLPNGDIVVKGKGGIGPGEPTGININKL